MKYFLRFSKSITLLFVTSYLVGSYYIMKIMIRDSMNSENTLFNGLIGITCLTISLILCYGFLFCEKRGPPIYQKFFILLYIFISYTLSASYFFIMLKSPLATSLIDILILLALLFQSIIASAILIEYAIEKKEPKIELG